MVKGSSRQVIVVQSPDRKLFEQAIFILREDALENGITDEMLLREARQAARHRGRSVVAVSGPLWALGGAMITAVIWFITTLL